MLPYLEAEQRQKEQRRRARRAVSKALASGRLQKQPCKRCGEPHAVEAHHLDYERELDVEWLCKACHDLEMAHAGR